MHTRGQLVRIRHSLATPDSINTTLIGAAVYLIISFSPLLRIIFLRRQCAIRLWKRTRDLIYGGVNQYLMLKQSLEGYNERKRFKGIK